MRIGPPIDLLHRLLPSSMVIVGCIGFAPLAEAHPISNTKAYVHVSSDHIEVRVKLVADELYLFHTLEPDANTVFSSAAIDRAIVKHGSFLIKHLSFRDGQQKQLKGRVDRIERFDVPPDGLTVEDLTYYRLSYRLVYNVSHDSAEFVVRNGLPNSDRLQQPPEIEFLIKHGEAGRRHSVLLQPGQECVFTIDSETDAVSVRVPDGVDTDNARDLSSHWQGQHDNVIQTYLYLDHHRTRFEALIPIELLSTLNPELRDRHQRWSSDSVEEYQAFATELLNSAALFTIGDDMVRPSSKQVVLFEDELDFLTSNSHVGELSAETGWVGIVWYLPDLRDRDEFDIAWKYYSNAVRTVDCIVFDDGEKNLYQFSEVTLKHSILSSKTNQKSRLAVSAVPYSSNAQKTDYRTISLFGVLVMSVAIWILSGRSVRFRRYAPLFVVLIVMIGVAIWSYDQFAALELSKSAAPISEREAESIFQALHMNIYVALQGDGENEVYDMLAKSVDGPALKELYLHINEDLQPARHGLSTNRIVNVEIIEGTVDSAVETNSKNGAGFQYRCQWAVEFVTEHWGHLHNSRRVYDALFTIEPRRREWKITAIEPVAK